MIHSCYRDAKLDIFSKTSGCCNCLPEPNYGGFAMFDLLQSQYQWLQDGNGGSNGYYSTGDSGVARVACNTENEGLVFHAGSAVYFVNNVSVLTEKKLYRKRSVSPLCYLLTSKIFLSDKVKSLLRAMPSGIYVWQISANCYVPASAWGDPERVWPAQI